MTDTGDTITISRARVAAVLEVLSTMATGDLDPKPIEALLGDHDDAFGEVEIMLRTLARDLAEVLSANDLYTREIEANAAELTEKLRTIERQQMAIQDLSTPVIEVWDDVLTLPIVGVVDTKRSSDMMERLLHSIVQHQAKCVIIDVTGVEIVDTATADHFVKMIRAAGMLGAYCVVSGINPEVALTLSRIGVELEGVNTQRSLKDALRHCFKYIRERSVPVSERAIKISDPEIER